MGVYGFNNLSVRSSSREASSLNGQIDTKEGCQLHKIRLNGVCSF